MQNDKNEPFWDSHRNENTDSNRQNTQNEIAVTGLQRSSVIVKTALSIGTHKAQSILKRNWRDDESETRTKERKELASILFKGLCQLRGTALKIAQAISAEMEIFDPEQIEVLQQSQYRVPGINSVLIAKVIRNEFNKNPTELFVEFEKEAFAAASLGQVHRAKLPSGDKVAVKIQYPGIDKSLSVDVGFAKKLISPLPRNNLLINTLDFLEARLREEVDYLCEQQYAHELKRKISHPHVYVPKVYPEYSTRKVITYELIDGLHLNDWLRQSPTQAAKNHLGQLIWDLFFECMLQHRLLHTDPHWGNFLIKADGTLVLIDFGSSQRISDDIESLFRALWGLGGERSMNELISIYRKLGASAPSFTSLEDENQPDGCEDPQTFFETAILPYKSWIDQFRATPSIDFSQNKGRALAVHKIVIGEVFNPWMRQFSSEFTMIHRTFLGIVQTLEAMDCQVQTDRLNSLS